MLLWIFSICTKIVITVNGNVWTDKAVFEHDDNEDDDGKDDDDGGDSRILLKLCHGISSG